MDEMHIEMEEPTAGEKDPVRREKRRKRGKVWSVDCGGRKGEVWDEGRLKWWKKGGQEW